MELEYLLSKVSTMFQKTLKRIKYEALGKEEAQKLSLHHFSYILAIQELGNPTFTELSEKLKVTKPSVTAMVNKLIQEGYVYKRQSAEDRRTFHVYLDEKGQQLFEIERRGVTAFADQIRYVLSETEMKQFIELMRKIAQSHAE
jgi:DNA-binding MarR family transcriptional regulator